LSEVSQTRSRYPVPSGTCRTEEEIKRSRFITTVGHTPSVEEARAFVDRIRSEFSDAGHNCWAYQVGPPGSTLSVGMSDDGEPRGTAGRPMLAVILNSGVGDITAVVTRYWGGIKLGKGGLVRAYSGGVQQALRHLTLTERVIYERVRVELAYTYVTMFQRLLPEYEAEVESETYAADVDYRLRLPDGRVGPFLKAVADLTNGRARTKVTEAPPSQSREDS
jgi:uncharacterized YigZ family protein